MSEEYFQLADKMVDAAENCSQRYATQINQIEKALIVIMILIVALPLWVPLSGIIPA